jgi:hypothetical protein
MSVPEDSPLLEPQGQCAWCPPGTPAIDQHDAGHRLIGGEWRRVYVWLCDQDGAALLQARDESRAAS